MQYDIGLLKVYNIFVQGCLLPEFESVRQKLCIPIHAEYVHKKHLALKIMGKFIDEYTEVYTKMIG